jgi:hypothetical protein
MIFLSCGHDVDSFDEVFDIAIKSHDQEGNKAIAYMSVCSECDEMYRKNGMILYTSQQEMDWLRSKFW